MLKTSLKKLIVVLSTYELGKIFRFLHIFLMCYAHAPPTGSLSYAILPKKQQPWKGKGPRNVQLTEASLL